MTDVTAALEAKSDQLNATDIIGVEPVIKIRDVKVKAGDQPVSVYYDGDNNKPWKPSKGMLRVLAGAWGRDSSAWIGKHAQLYFEPTVRYAGVEVGGIRVRALSDIPAKGLDFALTISKQKREPYHVPVLKVQVAEYPADKFEQAFDVMTKKLQSYEMTLPQLVAQCQKTGQLTNEQLQRLEAVVPVEIENEEDIVL
jgi:hypothetical protein